MEEGDEVGAKASMATLTAFNRCVLHLGRLARDRGASQFIADGLQAFRQLVPFASAWWGEMSTSDASAPPQSWMHGRINLPESFAVEWHKSGGQRQIFPGHLESTRGGCARQRVHRPL